MRGKRLIEDVVEVGIFDVLGKIGDKIEGSESKYTRKKAAKKRDADDDDYDDDYDDYVDEDYDDDYNDDEDDAPRTISKNKKSMRCYKCGGPMKKFDDGWAICFDCGRRIRYKYDGSKTVVIRKNDTEYQRRRETQKEFWSFLKSDSGRIAMLLVVCVAFLVCLLYWASKSSEEARQRRQADIAMGKISAGHYEDYDDENYEAVIRQLEALGFTNIEVIDLNDSGLLFWNDGDVESVSIEGRTQFTRDSYFDPNAKIIIKYH